MSPPPPRVGERSRAYPTDPRLLILISLAAADRHGYGIREDIETFTGVVLHPSSLYGAITRLTADGLIDALPHQGRQRPCRLTVASGDYLQARLSELERVSRIGRRRLKGSDR